MFVEILVLENIRVGRCRVRGQSPLSHVPRSTDREQKEPRGSGDLFLRLHGFSLVRRSAGSVMRTRMTRWRAVCSPPIQRRCVSVSSVDRWIIQESERRRSLRHSLFFGSISPSENLTKGQGKARAHKLTRAPEALPCRALRTHRGRARLRIRCVGCDRCSALSPLVSTYIENIEIGGIGGLAARTTRGSCIAIHPGPHVAAKATPSYIVPSISCRHVTRRGPPPPLSFCRLRAS